jgi:hypothetical protein
MPWESVQQARWGHTPTGIKTLGGKAKVAEWDAATPKGSLKMTKGSGPKEASYAAGGPVLGRSRDFLKTADEFTGGRLPPKMSAPVPQDYAGTSGGFGRDKSEKPVKPRK